MSVLLAILASQVSIVHAEIPAEPDYFETSVSVPAPSGFVGSVFFTLSSTSALPIGVELIAPDGSATGTGHVGSGVWFYDASNANVALVLGGDWRLRLRSGTRVRAAIHIGINSSALRCYRDSDCQGPAARCHSSWGFESRCERSVAHASFCAQNPVGTPCAEGRFCTAASVPHACMDRTFLTEDDLPLDIEGAGQSGPALRVPSRAEIFGNAAPNGEDIFAVDVQENQTLTVALRDPADGEAFDGPAPFGPFTVAIQKSGGGPVEPGPSGLAEQMPALRVAGLDAGVYEVTVSANTAASYLLSLNVFSPVCGNGLREFHAGELCDGTDSPFSLPCDDCQPRLPEALRSSVVITPSYEMDRVTVIPVVLEQDADLSVRLVDPVQGCVPTDYPELRLLDTDLETVLDDAAAGASFDRCPSVSTSRRHRPELGRIEVPAGTYYLVMGPMAGRGANTPQLEITIRNREDWNRDLSEFSHEWPFPERTYNLLNENAETPNPLSLPDRSSVILAGAWTADESPQRYSIEAAEGERLAAALVFPEGGCYGPWDTQLVISSAQGPIAPIVKSRDGCWWVVANDLDAGTYELQVQRTGEEAFGLAVYVAPPRCGDGTVDRKAGEDCEPGPIPPDGKLVCSEVCIPLDAPVPNRNACASPDACAQAFAPWRNLPLAAGMVAHLDQSLQDANDIFEQPLEVYEDLLMTVRTFTPDDDAAELCPPGQDITMSLTGADGTLLAYNDDLMTGSRCPGFDAIPLVAGEKYLLRIKHYSTDGIGEPFRFSIRTQSANVCGNGVVEPSTAETCDDGNVRSRDGCSSICQVESVTFEPETEPNNTFEQAVTLPYGIDRAFEAALGGDGDGSDIYALWVPPGQARTLTVETYDPNVETCWHAPVDTVVSLENADGFRIAWNDDAVGLCSRLSRALAGGDTGTLYYLRIKPYAEPTRHDEYRVDFRWQ